jgi:hypothetical protein
MTIKEALENNLITTTPWICPCNSIYNSISSYCWNCKRHITEVYEGRNVTR